MRQLLRETATCPWSEENTLSWFVAVTGPFQQWRLFFFSWGWMWEKTPQGSFKLNTIRYCTTDTNRTNITVLCCTTRWNFMYSCTSHSRPKFLKNKQALCTLCNCRYTHVKLCKPKTNRIIPAGQFFFVFSHYEQVHPPPSPPTLALVQGCRGF